MERPMRCFDLDHDHEAVGRHLRREAMKGFQRSNDPSSLRYVDACTCGVNLVPAPNSVSLIFTRDYNPDCKVGWHLSVCCVTHRSYRGYVPEEGLYWLGIIFGHYADRAIEQPLDARSPVGVKKDVRHFLIECDWTSKDPVVRLEGLC
jgi:hypothetical protein